MCTENNKGLHVSFDTHPECTSPQKRNNLPEVTKEAEDEWITSAIRKYELREWNNDMNEYNFFFYPNQEVDETPAADDATTPPFCSQASSVKEKQMQKQIDSLKQMISYLNSQLDIKRKMSFNQIESVEQKLRTFYNSSNNNNNNQKRASVVKSHSSPTITRMSFNEKTEDDNPENDFIYEENDK